MRLGSRVVLFVVATSVVPLVVLAANAVRIAESELADALAREQVATAAQLADGLSRQLNDIERVLAAQVGNFRLDVAPDEARNAFVISTWRLFPEVAIAALLDPTGSEAASPAYAETETEAGAHDVVDAERYARFRGNVPEPSAAITRGSPYVPDQGEGAVIPVVFVSPYGDGLSLAVELSLRPLRRQLGRVAGADRAALLVDSNGEVLLAAGQSPLVDPARLLPLLASEAADARVDNEVVVATTRLPGRDLVAVVAAPADSADRVLQAVLRPTAFILAVSLLAAAVAGLFLGRTITDPVAKLRDAAQAVGTGDLSRRVGMDELDELGELGRSFDGMTSALELSRDEIAAKNREIENWNVTLQMRVDERTRQLLEAQSRLVQSSQLAAVADLSAGLAHELNNPLAGLLGLVQVVRQMRAGNPDAVLLATAEEQALRCKEIVGKLLRFTGEIKVGERERVDLAGIVRDVVGLSGSAFRQREVALEMDASNEGEWVLGHPEELGRALTQVLNALRAVAAAGSTLSVYVNPTKSGVGPVRVEFRLDGVRDSEDDWRASALGLWAARQVLAAHEATLEEVPVPTGRCWHLSAPRLSR